MPTNNEEQFKFLISCIRYSNNGKVDFAEVAAECGIVTKGAAAKRYERMMKAHGIASNATSVRQPSSTPRAPKVVSNKKRKADQFAEERAAADDDEALDNIKSEVQNTDCMTVKEEVMQHQMYSPGNMSDELGLELMQVKEESMPRAYENQNLNHYVHLSNGETLFDPSGLNQMTVPMGTSHYGNLEVVSRDNTPLNSYFTNMDHAYEIPSQDAFGLSGFERDELILVDAHGRPT